MAIWEYIVETPRDPSQSRPGAFSSKGEPRQSDSIEAAARHGLGMARRVWRERGERLGRDSDPRATRRGGPTGLSKIRMRADLPGLHEHFPRT
jgi:hypothetical protein